MITPNAVKRANQIDEPIVRTVLQEKNIACRTGTFNDDWNHIDLFVQLNTEDEDIQIDVKRNSAKQWQSSNFTFTFEKNNKIFPFKEHAYFAFIDDVDFKIYMIKQLDLQNLVNSSKHHQSKYNNSKYIIFSKTTSKAISSRIYDIDDFSKTHLIMTRELKDNN